MKNNATNSKESSMVERPVLRQAAKTSFCIITSVRPFSQLHHSPAKVLPWICQ